jgi:hypothetical protein
MCESPNGAPMGHSSIPPLDHPRDQDVSSKVLDEHNVDVLHCLGVHPIRKLFW